MSDLLDRLDELVEEDDLEGVERLALRSLKNADPDVACELWRYVAWARLEMGRPSEALDAALSGEDALYEAKAHFQLWDFDACREALARVEDEGDEAEAEWYRGLVAEFTGGDPASHRRRACKLDPDAFHLPARLSDSDIDQVIRDAISGLPPAIATAIEGVGIEVMALPRPSPDMDPLALGMYLGVSALERSHEQLPHLPARIEIYRDNIRRIARDKKEAIEELRITLLHEVGHHLGYDEEGLARLDLE